MRRSVHAPASIGIALAAALACSTARASSADPAGTSEEPYPLSVGLRIVSAGHGTEYRHDGLIGPRNPSSTTDLAAQARGAYERALRAAFRLARPGEPSLSLEVTLAAFGLDGGGDRWTAFVEHTVVLSESGEELARWRERGLGRVVGLAANAIPRAFERANRAAAERFARRLEEIPRWATWLRERGIPPRRLPEPKPPTPPTPLAPRGRILTFLDGGLAYAGGAADLLVPEIRTGIALPWALAQVSCQWRGESFEPHPPFSSDILGGRLDVTAVGLDLGGLSRPWPGLELRAGVGAHWMRGRAVTTYRLGSPAPLEWELTRTGTVASLFVGATFFGPFPGLDRLKGRVGIELRSYFGGALDFGSVDYRFQPGVVAGIHLGLETPLRLR